MTDKIFLTRAEKLSLFSLFKEMPTATVPSIALDEESFNLIESFFHLSKLHKLILRPA